MTSVALLFLRFSHVLKGGHLSICCVNSFVWSSVTADCLFLLICVPLSRQSSTSSKYCEMFSDITKIRQEASKNKLTQHNT